LLKFLFYIGEGIKLYAVQYAREKGLGLDAKLRRPTMADYRYMARRLLKENRPKEKEMRSEGKLEAFLYEIQEDYSRGSFETVHRTMKASVTYLGPYGKDLAYSRHEVQPLDIVFGLGSADRNLLAACLALFEDSTLSRRLEALCDNAVSKVSNQPTEDTVQSTADAVKNRMTEWMDSPLSHNSLRLALWIYLRDAFGLSARGDPQLELQTILRLQRFIHRAWNEPPWPISFCRYWKACLLQRSRRAQGRWIPSLKRI
jgi:hypothetical protein